jgi:hypothetical protein
MQAATFVSVGCHMQVACWYRPDCNWLRIEVHLHLCVLGDVVHQHAACAECAKAWSAWAVLRPVHVQAPRVTVVR